MLCLLFSEWLKKLEAFCNNFSETCEKQTDQ